MAAEAALSTARYDEVSHSREQIVDQDEVARTERKKRLHLSQDELREELSSLEDSTLVADLPFPIDLLRDRFITLAMSQNPKFDLAATLAPGRLGERWFMTAGAFALAALICLLFANRFDHASQCGRCGHRICTRCDETVWSEEICEGCHHLFKYPAATDPSLRMARLQALSKREVRIDRIVLAAHEPGKSTRLYVQDLAGGPPRAITPADMPLAPQGHATSHDGGRVVVTPADGPVAAFDIDGKGPFSLAGIEPGDLVLGFAEDAEHIYVQGATAIPSPIFKVNIKTGTRELWLELAPADAAGVFTVDRVRITPDGRSYIYSNKREVSSLTYVNGLQ